MKPEWVTWLLVILGWWYVHSATLKRERRKEKRELSSKLCTEFMTLRDSAISFHTADVFSQRASDDLSQELNRLIARLQRSPMSELEIPTGQMIALRKSVTLTNIDATDFKPRDLNGQLVTDIRSRTADLVSIIEDAREKIWP